jgi:hypothetical protein
MLITEVLKIEVHEVVADDWPDQAEEYRQEVIEKGLLEFLYRFVDKVSGSIAQERVIRFNLAMKLLESFQMNEASSLSSERSKARFPPSGVPAASKENPL